MCAHVLKIVALFHVLCSVLLCYTLLLVFCSLLLCYTLLLVLCYVLMCYTLLLVFFLVFTWNSGTFRRNLLTWASLQAVEYYNILEILSFSWLNGILKRYYNIVGNISSSPRRLVFEKPAVTIEHRLLQFLHIANLTGRGNLIFNKHRKTKNPNILPSTTTWLHLPWNPVCWDENLCFFYHHRFLHFKTKVYLDSIYLLRFSSSAREKWSGVDD